MRKIRAPLKIISFVLSLLSVVSAAHEGHAHSEEISKDSECVSALNMHITAPKRIAMVLGQEGSHIRGALEAGQASTSVTLCGTPGAKVRITVKAREGALLNEHDVSGVGAEYTVRIGRSSAGGKILKQKGMSERLTIPEAGQLLTNMEVKWNEGLKQPYPGVYQDTLTVQVALEN